MKDSYPLFASYNSAKSSSVKIINSKLEINISIDQHIVVPDTGKPNSVTIIKKDGNLINERYYDDNGEPYLDIDYTDHGNPKNHPEVPHEHHWIRLPNGKLKREKDTGVK